MLTAIEQDDVDPEADTVRDISRTGGTLEYPSRAMASCSRGDNKRKLKTPH